MKTTKWMELLGAMLAIAGLVAIMMNLGWVATALLTVAGFILMILFFVLSMGYMLVASLVFFIYGALCFGQLV